MRKSVAQRENPRALLCHNAAGAFLCEESKRASGACSERLPAAENKSETMNAFAHIYEDEKTRSASFFGGGKRETENSNYTLDLFFGAAGDIN